ncbi:MAG: PDZ domain-containing protein [Pirellulaceae bacterium]|nr:PDZ domain-containing protein [Pirellulaceae bacterium]
MSITLLLLVSGLAARADEAAPADPWPAAASKLQGATVTVRIWTGAQLAAANPLPAKPEAPEAVTVCSGVCVRQGSIVTAAMAGSDSRIRLTLPGGKQADAKLQVIDEVSGLALLRTDSTDATPLPLAEALPAVGAGVMTAAAWGIELPLVSQGIVAGIDRQRPGATNPPLLQCDLRTTETSSGAGVVDRAGGLVGVIIAADSPESRRGWAYAVPVSHVQRLLRAADEQQGAGVTIIKRRRPLVGMVLDQNDEAIVVQRVVAGGPAEKAGLKPGDQVLATDGVAIRSVYQAVLPTLYKQPGDTLTFRIQREGTPRDVQVVLGGGVEVTSAPFELLAGLMQPKVEVSRDAAGNYIAKRGERNVREVFAPPLPDEELPAAPAAGGATAAEKLALLEKALDRYRIVIEVQQKQLADEQNRRQVQEELIQSLRTEMEALRRQIEAAKGK